jgi:hypothetical protein
MPLPAAASNAEHRTSSTGTRDVLTEAA